MRFALPMCCQNCATMFIHSNGGSSGGSLRDFEIYSHIVELEMPFARAASFMTECSQRKSQIETASSGVNFVIVTAFQVLHRVELTVVDTLFRRPLDVHGLPKFAHRGMTGTRVSGA